MNLYINIDVLNIDNHIEQLNNPNYNVILVMKQQNMSDVYDKYTKLGLKFKKITKYFDEDFIYLNSQNTLDIFLNTLDV